MSKDVAARLDALANDYREGRLSLTGYRNLRAPLLDLLTSQLDVTVADPSTTTQRDKVARARNARRGDLPDAKPARRGLRVMGGLVVMAAMAAAAVTMYSRMSHMHAPARISRVPVDIAREPSQTLDDSEDWSDARLHSLLEEFDGRAVCRKELAGSPEPFCRDLLATADAGPQLLVLAASSAKAEGGARRLFAISPHEVSQAQFLRYCAHTAGRCQRQLRAQADDSVVNVTRDEAGQYLLWLSEMSGQTYRLPTEAEWRQAAHDGNKSGWRAGRAREWTQEQGSSKASVQDDLRGFRAVRELR